MLFTDLSHAVIVFNSVEGAKKTGINAMIKLCFGNDDDAINQILYKTRGNHPPVWELPTRNKIAGITLVDKFPIFTGKVADQVLAAVGRAADKLKKSGITNSFAGKSFRVSKTKVEEIKTETTQS